MVLSVATEKIPIDTTGDRPRDPPTNNAAPSLRYPRRRGKAISINYYECVFVALVVQHAMRMRCVVVCGLCAFAVFFHIIS